MTSASGNGPQPRPSGWAATQVHPTVRATAAWTWRLLIIAAGLYVVGKLFLRAQEVFVPVAIAILLAALLVPAVSWLERHRVPRSMAVLVTVLLTFAVLLGLLAFVVEQLVVGVPRMSGDVADTINQVRDWLETGPLNLDSDSLRNVSNDMVHWLKSHEATIASGAIDTAGLVSKLATAALLTLFVLIFFLYDGAGIWQFVTKIVPSANREHVRGAGEAGFNTLKAYVHATVLVALIDAVCIGVGLAVLRVPMVLPLAAIIFLGSFIPIVGSVAAGSLAVVVALATEGWIKALLVVVILIVVMQLEGHVLQPFLLGKSVKLHPVAVILMIAAGLLFAGIVGGLLAVPLLAFVNTASNYRSAEAAEGDDGDPPGLREETVSLDVDPPPDPV